MTDYTHTPSGYLVQFAQCVHNGIKVIAIKGAKSLINKHCVNGIERRIEL